VRSQAEKRLLQVVERTRAQLEAGRDRTADRLARDGGGGDDEARRKAEMLNRIRDFHRQTLFPIVHRKQRTVRGIGSVWVEEDIERLHEMPRASVHFASLDAGSKAPHAYMTFHVDEKGAAIVSRNYVTPVKDTDVTVSRFEDLTPERVEEMLNEFLVKALGG
jgi:hypothetical protein